jgi:hypothetical protein
VIEKLSGGHPEHLGREQRQAHHGAGAALLRAGDDRAGAVGVELDERPGRRREGRPPPTGDADRLVVREIAPVADHLQRGLEGLLGPDRRVDLPGRPDVTVLDEAAPAQLGRIHAEGGRDLVQVLLQGPARLGRRRGAHRAGRLVGRVDQPRLDRDRLELVRAAGVHRGQLREEPAFAAVGAAVEPEPAAPGEQPAVAGGAGFELDDHALAPVVGGDELLPAAEHQLDRAAGGPGQGGDVRLEVEVALAAEPAAEQRDDDPYVGLGHPERVGHPGPRGERHLRRAPDRDPVAGPLGEDRPRLDRRRLRRLGDVPAADDDVGGGHRGVRITLDDRRPAEDVAVPAQVLVGRVARPVLVDQRGARLGVRHVVGQRGQHLVLDVDRRGRLAGHLPSARGHGRHDLALEADDVLGEQVTVLGEPAVADPGDVGVSDHGDHPGDRPGPRRVDPDDPGVRVVGVAERRVELAGDRKVGGVPAGAGDLLAPVGPQERRPGRGHGVTQAHVSPSCSPNRGRPTGFGARRAFQVARRG